MQEIENLKQAILKEYPRLSKDSVFHFRCHKEQPCFNECCRDVNIFLTPYDIIRLKNYLGISSAQFLSKYTLTPFDQNLKYPVVLLMMGENEQKTCPFVAKQGCTVYPHRPWACRMYPLGLASPKEDKKMDQEFYFLLQETVCHGFQDEKEWTVQGWIEDQGIVPYDEMGEEFKKITLHRFFEKGGVLSPPKMEMFFMVCYNIDEFRKFIFESSFLEKFEIEENTIQKIKEDDIELLKFGYQWLRFSLFAEKTMKIKGPVLEAKKKILEEQNKRSL